MKQIILDFKGPISLASLKENEKEANFPGIYIWGFKTPFLKKQFYTPAMKGSWSLKYVLPALVPELSYRSIDKDHLSAVSW